MRVPALNGAQLSLTTGRQVGNHTSDKLANQTPLIIRLENEVEYLHRDFEDWKEEARCKDHLLAALWSTFGPNWWGTLFGS